MYLAHQRTKISKYKLQVYRISKEIHSLLHVSEIVNSGAEFYALYYKSIQ